MYVKKQIFFLQSRSRGISELTSSIILIMITVFFSTLFYMTTLYYVGERIDAVMTELNLIEANIDKPSIIDTYYIATNNTLVIYVYYDGLNQRYFVRAYIDYVLIPRENLTKGFYEPVPSGIPFRLEITYNLSQGTHKLILVDSLGGVIEADVTI